MKEQEKCVLALNALREIFAKHPRLSQKQIMKEENEIDAAIEWVKAQGENIHSYRHPTKKIKTIG